MNHYKNKQIKKKKKRERERNSGAYPGIWQGGFPIQLNVISGRRPRIVARGSGGYAPPG